VESGWRSDGALRWKVETISWEGREVVCGKSAPSKLYPPPVSIKDRWVGPRKQVLNVPIVCRWYEPDKPSSWLSTEACLFLTVSLAVVEEKLGTNPWIRWLLSCGLCRELFFSGAMDLYNSVDDFIKGYYMLTGWDTYDLGPYADWAWDAWGVLVGFSI
jgi:hypothetical protein